MSLKDVKKGDVLVKLDDEIVVIARVEDVIFTVPPFCVGCGPVEINTVKALELFGWKLKQTALLILELGKVYDLANNERALILCELPLRGDYLYNVIILNNNFPVSPYTKEGKYYHDQESIRDIVKLSDDQRPYYVKKFS